MHVHYHPEADDLVHMGFRANTFDEIVGVTACSIYFQEPDSSTMFPYGRKGVATDEPTTCLTCLGAAGP